jgi:hypothetical protein
VSSCPIFFCDPLEFKIVYIIQSRSFCASPSCRPRLRLGLTSTLCDIIYYFVDLSRCLPHFYLVAIRGCTECLRWSLKSVACSIQRDLVCMGVGQFRAAMQRKFTSLLNTPQRSLHQDQVLLVSVLTANLRPFILNLCKLRDLH